MDFRDYVQRSIAADQRLAKYYRTVAGPKQPLVLKCRYRSRKGTLEYYVRNVETGEERYLGIKDYKKITALQRQKFAEQKLEILECNINTKAELCGLLLDDDMESVLASLPRAYRPNEKLEEAYAKALVAAGQTTRSKAASEVKQSENPFKPENLKIRTSFGLFVRSKGELAIAEVLHGMDIRFYYEKALALQVQRREETGVPYRARHTYYPDFTIPLRDGTAVYWEHQGLSADPNYAYRSAQKEVDYNQNGIFQAHNLIVTGEGPNNMIDMDGITRMIDGWLMPLLAI